MPTVIIKMLSGNVQCAGEVVRLGPSGAATVVARDVRVRKTKASEALHLDHGHHQFRFAASGGVGAFAMEATNASKTVVGSLSYPGVIQVGLILDLYVP